MWLLQMASAPMSDEDGSLGRRLTGHLVPANWTDLPIGFHARAQNVLKRFGVCVVWVPRGAVVRALAGAATKADCDAVLVANETQILEDVAAALDAVRAEELELEVDAAREALAVYRNGHRRASQTLCSSLLGHVLAEHFQEPKFADALRRLEPSDEPVALRSARRTWVGWAISSALLRGSTDNRTRRGFNRHVTAHGLYPEQFTQAHALSALLLAGGVLRQLQADIDERAHLTALAAGHIGTLPPPTSSGE